MKKIRKILISLFVILLLCVNMPVINTRAADISVSIALSSTTVNVGDTVTATISVSGSNISAYTIYVSYSSGVLSYSSGSGMVTGGGGTATISGTGAGSVSITFTAISSGTASISTYGDDAWSIEATQLSISHAGVNVKVVSPSTTEQPPNTTQQPPSTEATTESTTEATTEDEEDTNECLLKSLTVSPGVLEPSFSPATTSYFLQVDENVTAIDVNAVAEYSSSRVSVSGASNIIPGENHISITVTDKEGATKNYSIRVMAGKEKGDPFVTINGKKYDFVADKESELIPEGYKAVDETYEDWDIVAFMSPNRKILLVCLQDENEKQSLYIYDREKNIFTLYREYQAGENRYVILEWNDDIELPAGCEKSQLMIDGELVSAYKLKDSIYLLYAMNIKGDEGLYLYDFKEKTFMRYADFSDKADVATNTDATPSDAVTDNIPADEPRNEGFFTRQVLIYFLAGTAILLLLLIIIVICLAVKNKKLKKQKADEDTKNSYSEEISDKPEITGAMETPVDSEVTDNTDNVEISEKPETEVTMENPVEPEVKDDMEISVKKEEKNEIEEVPQITSFDTVIDSESDTYREYEEQSEIIKNKIKVDYDANMDSAFNVDE